MTYALKCDYCGKEFTRKREYRESTHRFCSRACSARWVSAKGQTLKTFTMENRGTLPHDDVNVRITADLDLFPGYRPNVGSVYKAERYQGQGGSKLIGYVIAVNGHRVNIRQNECVEV